MRRDLLLVLALSVAYFTATAALADRKLLWTDELFTLHMAEQPSAGALWREILSGTDAQPPLTDYAAQASIRLLGAGHVALRLPSIVGYWLMSACIFLFVRRYASTTYAVVAALVPVCTLAYGYAFEARSYGLMLGCGAAVLACWQSACVSGRRAGWLAGLALSVAAALATHWFALLLLIPLGFGELVRARRRGRPDLPMWGAIAAGAATMVAYVPIAFAARAFQGITASPWTARSAVLTTVESYQTLLQGAAPLFLAVILVLAVCAVGARVVAEPAVTDASPVPPEVLAMLLALLLMPVWGVLLAWTVIGVFYPRYVLLTVIGVAIAVGLSAARLGGGRRSSEMALLVTMTVAAAYYVAQAKLVLHERSAITERSGLFAILRCEPALADSREPIVVPDLHGYFTLYHYAPATLAKRLVYLSDSDITSSPSGRTRWFPGTVRVYSEFVRDQTAFLVYDGQYFTQQAPPALLPRLIAQGFALTDAGCGSRQIYTGSGQLYEAKATRESRSGGRDATSK